MPTLFAFCINLHTNRHARAVFMPRSEHKSLDRRSGNIATRSGINRIAALSGFFVHRAGCHMGGNISNSHPDNIAALVVGVDIGLGQTVSSWSRASAGSIVKRNIAEISACRFLHGIRLCFLGLSSQLLENRSANSVLQWRSGKTHVGWRLSRRLRQFSPWRPLVRKRFSRL